MKKSKILLCLTLLLILTGCNSEVYDYTMIADYKIYFDEANFVTSLISNEKVKSDNEKIIKYFEIEFNNGNDLFKDLDAYTSKIVKEDNTIINEVSVDYSNIVADDFIEIGVGTIYFTDDKFDSKKFISYLNENGALCTYDDNYAECVITVDSTMDKEILDSSFLD